MDFSYEVSRSLSACEGALLIVDAAQGVEAQTVANVHLAMKQNLAIIPVINKIDLPHANVPMIRQQLEDILAIPGDTAIPASAKEGIGVEEILEAIITRVPPPQPTGQGGLQALCFDSILTPTKGWSRMCGCSTENESRHAHPAVAFGQKLRSQGSGQFQSETLRPEQLRVGETGT